jgi:ferredoxin
MTTIFCFTSTGNSLYVAKRIAEKSGGEIAPMNADPGIINDDVVGFVYPVYFWGLPRMMDRFIKELRIENKDAYIFAVATYGGAAPGVNNLVRKLLRKKGLDLNYGNYVKLVDNYIPMYKPKDSEGLQEKAEKRISGIAEAVFRREKNRIAPDTFINPLSFSAMPGEDSDRHFKVSDACSGCAVCEKICPAQNITIEDGKPVFHHRCEHCMGCLQNCPAVAIDWKEKTKSRARFRKNGVSLNELIAFNQGESLYP